MRPHLGLAIECRPGIDRLIIADPGPPNTPETDKKKQEQMIENIFRREEKIMDQ